MNRTEYNAICQARGYNGLTDKVNTYMKGDAVVCTYEALNKFDMKYKEAQLHIRENKMEEDFEEDDDWGDM